MSDFRNEPPAKQIAWYERQIQQRRDTITRLRTESYESSKRGLQKSALIENAHRDIERFERAIKRLSAQRVAA